MRVFISWSGDRSHAVAELLHDWIKCVLQASDPWLSSRDIDRGALWFTEINDQLKDTSVGIICLTQENLNRPWLLFEAGALAKGLSTSRVCTLLIDVKPSDLDDPLAQFNHTFPVKDSIFALVRSLNKQCPARLDDKILDKVLETYWEQFEKSFSQALKKHPATEKKEQVSDEKMLEKIYDLTHSLTQRMTRLEHGQNEAASGGASSQSSGSFSRDMIEAWVNENLKRGMPIGKLINELLSSGYSIKDVDEMIGLSKEYIKSRS